MPISSVGGRDGWQQHQQRQQQQQQQSTVACCSSSSAAGGGGGGSATAAASSTTTMMQQHQQQQQQQILHQRPTEAQLRWAQFHHKKRAIRVKAIIERMYQTPTTIQEVPGALPEDGNTSSSSGSRNEDDMSDTIMRKLIEEEYDHEHNHNDENKERRPNQQMPEKTATSTTTWSSGNKKNQNKTGNKKKVKDRKHKKKKGPSISRGRRALLRVSKRDFELRKQQQLEDGYYQDGRGGDEDDDEDQHVQDDEEALAAIFAEESVWKKRKRRRRTRPWRRRGRRGTTTMGGGPGGTVDDDGHHIMDEEEERVRRFEDALNSMMMSLAQVTAAAAAEPPDSSGSAGDLRWSVNDYGRHHRHSYHGVGGAIVPDAMSTMHRYSPLRNPMRHPGIASMPIDRGASWLVHLPTMPTPSMSSTGSSTTASGPNTRHSLPQHYMPGTVVNSTQPNSSSSSSNVNKTACHDNELSGHHEHEHDDDDIHPPPPIRRHLDAVTKRFLEGLAQQQQKRRDQQQQQQQQQLRQQQHSAIIASVSPGQVKRFVEAVGANVGECIIMMANADNDGSCGCQLYDKEAFEQLVLRYLTSNSNKNTTQNSKSSKDNNRNCRWVRHFVDKIEHAISDNGEGVLLRHSNKNKNEAIGDDTGRRRIAAIPQLDVIAFERLVSRCLAEAEQEVQEQGQRRASSSNIRENGKIKIPSAGRVKRFVETMEMAIRREEWITADGRLRQPEFAKLVLRYLASTKKKDASGQQTSLSEKDDNGNMRWVKRFVEKMERASLSSDCEFLKRAVDGEALDAIAFERLVTRCLFEAAADVEAATAATAKGNKDAGDGIEDDEDHSSFFSAAPDQDIADGMRRMKFVDGQRSEMDSNPSHENINSAVGFMSNMLFGRTNAVDQGIASTLKKKDDIPSLSSFQLFPEGFKKVVQGLRGNDKITEVVDDFEEELMNAEESFTESEEIEGSSYFDRTSDSVDDYTASSSGHNNFSHEGMMALRLRMEQSQHRYMDSSVIDTDGSEASFGGNLHPQVAASLLLSPTILTKRHQQAIRAVECRSWDQVSYLLHANPWLAEMTDVNTNQYLLHKLAYSGAGEAVTDFETGELILDRKSPTAPEHLNLDLMRMFPAAVHKLDNDGNLPLHMAAASGNYDMAQLLGERFPEGASVRNEDGMLPLHLAILACAAPPNEEEFKPIEIIELIMGFFPGAIAVPDNEGNMPIHIAADVLRGDLGVDVIHCLLDEVERQLEDPFGIRFRNKMNLAELEKLQTEGAADPTADMEDGIPCMMVYNERGETPLMAAIRSRAGYDVIDALVSAPGGIQASFVEDSDLNNALHHVVNVPYKDPAAVLAILKSAPQTARHRNDAGMLPIEIACMQVLPREIILALVLVDLPIDLDQHENVERRKGYGASWWYLVCECDDYYSDVVAEVISLCSYAQIRSMAFAKSRSKGTLLSRATPKSRDILQRELRFIGRFEFVGSEPTHIDSCNDMTIFEAIDYGVSNNNKPTEGRRVLLKCFARQKSYNREIALLHACMERIDFSLLEEICTFTVGGEYWGQTKGVSRFFLSVEQPNLTLGGVLNGMLENEECQTNLTVRKKYAVKVFAVLRFIAKALQHLHTMGLVHGNVSLENCCRFGDRWKLADILKTQRAGEMFVVDRISNAAPPEAIERLANTRIAEQARLRDHIVASPSIDVWALGKLAFEVLVGEPLIRFDTEEGLMHDQGALMTLLRWSYHDIEGLYHKLNRVGVSNAGMEMIGSCLSPSPEQRPPVHDILRSPLWDELRRDNPL